MMRSLVLYPLDNRPSVPSAAVARRDSRQRSRDLNGHSQSLSFSLTLVLSLLALALGTPGCSDRGTTSPSATTGNEVQALIDPETGLFVEPFPSNVTEKSAAVESVGWDWNAVEEVELPSGGYQARVEGGFRQPLVAVIQEDGTIRYEHRAVTEESDTGNRP